MNAPTVEKASAQSRAEAFVLSDIAEAAKARAQHKHALLLMPDSEIVPAWGFYDFKLLFPRAAHFEKFVRLRDEISRIEALPLMERIRFLARLDYLKTKLSEEVEQEVQAEGPIINTVATVGKNLALDTFLTGSSYTATGPYVGLISSGSYSATAAGDTMASHAGWLEAGSTTGPTYSGTRKTPSWSSASAGSKAFSAASSFSMTNGTNSVQGCFLLYGSGALTTIDNTAGTLWSAGSFAAAQPVANGNTVTVTYTTGL